MSTEVYDRLALLFRRATVLPQLPGSAIQLLKMLEQSDARDPTVERIISSDPALAASIIRIASSALYGGVKVTTIRSAMLRIGERSIKSLALSLTMQSMTHSIAKNSQFDPYRYSRHSLFVGMMASALHARMETTRGNLEWSSEEILAIGILHDLYAGILARIAPEVYGAAVAFATDHGLRLDQALQAVLGRPAWELGVMMFEAWGMPPVFVEAVRRINQPIAEGDELRSYSALIAAHDLAHEFDCQLEHWPLTAPAPRDRSWPLPPHEELIATMQVVRNEAEAFLQTTLAIPA